jgi:hypothetical protein
MKGLLQLEVASPSEALATDFIPWVRDAIARLPSAGTHNPYHPD